MHPISGALLYVAQARGGSIESGQLYPMATFLLCKQYLFEPYPVLLCSFSFQRSSVRLVHASPDPASSAGAISNGRWKTI